MIKSRADVVNAVSKDSRQVNRGLLIDDKKNVTEFVIVVKIEMAEVAVQVGDTLFPERIDVLFCTFQLEVSTVERMRHDLTPKCSERRS